MMTIVNRMTKLFKADVHGILDKIEEPELILRQAIREMEEELAREELSIKKDIEHHEQIAKRRDRLAEKIKEYSSQLDTCLAADKRDLAKNVMRRKLEDENLFTALNQKLEDSVKNLEKCRGEHAQRRDQLASIRQKAELLVAQRPVAAAPDDIRMDVMDDEVEIALMREMEKRGKSAKRGGAS